MHNKHLSGLNALAEEYVIEKKILVSTDPFERQIGDIILMPWNIFLNRLWAGDIIK